MSDSDECVFCAIASGGVEASRVAESPRVLAFMDIDPVTAGHVLVIPKEHLTGLANLSDAIAGEMLATARRVAAALRASCLRCEGVNLFVADGEAAGQEVPHAHLHVFPRYAGDGFTLSARWGSAPTRGELDERARAIRSAL